MLRGIFLELRRAASVSRFERIARRFAALPGSGRAANIVKRSVPGASVASVAVACRVGVVASELRRRVQ
jgi:hypothetical protein